MRLKEPAFAAVALILMIAAGNEAMTANFGTRRIMPLPVVTTPPVSLPDDKVRTALIAEKLDQAQQGRISQQARAYLVEEPLSSDALWMISTSQKAHQRPATLALAERVSRRAAYTQFALFLAHSEDNDLAATMKHLDRLLTVFPDMGTAALAKLAASTASPDMRAALRPMAKRPWFGAFLLQAVENAPDGNSLFQLLDETNALAGTPSPGLVPAILQRLVRDGQISEAATLAERHAGLSAATRSQFGLTTATTTAEARPLTWSLASDESANMVLKSANIAALTIEPGRSATLLSRVTMLRPGTYQLSMTAALSDPRAALRWELSCLSGTGESAGLSQSVPATAEKAGFSMQLQIDASCPAQRWTLKGTTLDVQFPVDGEITALSLTPARD